MWRWLTQCTTAAVNPVNQFSHEIVASASIRSVYDLYIQVLNVEDVPVESSETISDIKTSTGTKRIDIYVCISANLYLSVCNVHLSRANAQRHECIRTNRLMTRTD